MAQAYLSHRNLKQGIVPGWTQQCGLPIGAVEVPSQSASSAVISPASCDDDSAAFSESSGQSSSSLKERDYIGLAEVSSAPTSREAEAEGELRFAETDLRLGLGLALDALDNGPQFVPSSTSTPHKPEPAKVASHTKEGANIPPSMFKAWQNVSTRGLVGATPTPHGSGFQGAHLMSSSKNGGKRMYVEAMASVARDARLFMNVNSSSGAVNICDSMSSANQIVPMNQFHDMDVKGHSLHPQGVLWAPSPHVPSWQPQASYRSVASQNGVVFPSSIGEEDGEALRNTKLEIAYQSDKTRVQSVAVEESTLDDAPPRKGQVVGWPPVPSYRRNTLGTRTKPTSDEGAGQSAVYVKVNMEGIPIGRKVDLNAYKSYESLLTALEDMFHNPVSGPGTRFLKGPEFVLTYEDKEGDWMLVGDVPWGMFVNTVRRLRITRASDMTGLGSRASCCA